MHNANNIDNKLENHKIQNSLNDVVPFSMLLISPWNQIIHYQYIILS